MSPYPFGGKKGRKSKLSQEGLLEEEIMAEADHVDLFQQIAQTNKLPPSASWNDVLPLLLRETRAALLSAASNILPATDTENFAAENAYILEQLELLHAPPFTLQRLCEILLQPSAYHTSHATGKLRGELLQSAVRRCVLVAPTE